MTDSNPFRWHLGAIMVQKGWITLEQLNQALQIQNQEEARALDNLSAGMGGTGAKKKQAPSLFLGEILIMHQLIRWENKNIVDIFAEIAQSPQEYEILMKILGSHPPKEPE